ncbi:unnamed protein product [Orchesella dallaii]|uniref:GPI ethanolamine phosphate transferase 2 C-terminal domain-containing protein n=1 Tax=Orchesella dallaii TaxID=48710 RepID=A0ABP1PZ83_9HEXA
MTSRVKAYLIIIAVFQCISLCILLMGITGGFESATSNDEDVHKKGDDKPKNLSEAEASSELVPEKVVLVVIDALRLDFMTEENFPFLLGTLGKYQSTSVLKFDVKVDSPTVTLPRVKTLVTGKAPVYLDVLRNFQTADTLKHKSGLNQPNLIASLRKELPDLNICFFGDETWLRLFPAEDDSYSPYFKKWEGVTSFYVRDFYEVDNNVTRHLEDIDECNFLILHYLGLDHIGHVFGPKQTDLLKRKLVEMDHVLQHLHSHLSQMKSKGTKNLLLVTGDHGMANVGGHGGSSYEEVFTPLIGVVIGGLPFHHPRLETKTINQIDIAPTLAAIWNLEIPHESRGQLILDLIEQFKSTDQLANYYQKNCKQLLSVLGKTRKAATYKLWWTEISKMEKPLAIKKYIELEQELASTLQNTKSSNANLLCSFVVAIIILLCMQVYLFSCLKKVLGRHTRYALGVVCLPPVLLYFSSSFIEEEHYIRYYLYPSILILYVLWNNGHKQRHLVALKIMILHRIGMSLNQTGDKWSHLPDLNDIIQDHQLQWLTAAIAVILLYLHSQKTVKCSRSYKIALLAVYVTKVVTVFFDESSRDQIHWLLVDSKLQKVAFFLIFLHFIQHLYKGHVRNAFLSTVLVFFLSLQRLQNFLALSIVFTQQNYLGKLIIQQHEGNMQDKSHKSSNRINSIIYRVLIIWFAHASFYYQGNSNGLATVDVTAGYIGIESYSSNFLIGSLIFFNTFSSPLLIYLFIARSHSPKEVAMNGSVHVSNQANNVKGRKDKGQKSMEFLPILILLSMGAESITYCCSVLIFQNHLFIWSVFVPKLMYIISQSVVCAIACTFHAFLF